MQSVYDFLLLDCSDLWPECGLLWPLQPNVILSTGLFWILKNLFYHTYILFKASLFDTVAENYGIQAVVSYWSSSTDLYILEPVGFYIVNSFSTWCDLTFRWKVLKYWIFCREEFNRLICTLLFKVQSTVALFHPELVRNVHSWVLPWPPY